jgi:hypothetical protein
MPKYISDKDLSPIETVLVARSEGWGIGEIEKALKGLGLSLNRRTLQRRLALLEKQGRIQIVGAGRATRYLVLATPDKTNETKDGIFLSADAKEIEKLISRPLTARHPIGYQRKFIDSYEPNVSRYLQPAMRSHLKDIGRRTGVDYAAGTYIRQILGRLLIDLSWARKAHRVRGICARENTVRDPNGTQPQSGD